MLYNGHKFQGDKLLQLRCDLLHKVWNELSVSRPFVNPDVVNYVRYFKKNLTKSLSSH